MKQLAVFALAIIVFGHWRPAQAAPPAIAVDEINYLLGFIGSSGCKFYRNGSWYDSHRAQSHLHDKYNYLVARGRIKTADDFIEQAATRSSLSGEEYQIQCEAGPAVPSNRWLRSALGGYRLSVGRHATPNSSRLRGICPEGARCESDSMHYLDFTASTTMEIGRGRSATRAS